jgi:hypothetical protein
MVRSNFHFYTLITGSVFKTQGESAVSMGIKTVIVNHGNDKGTRPKVGVHAEVARSIKGVKLR